MQTGVYWLGCYLIDFICHFLLNVPGMLFCLFILPPYLTGIEEISKLNTCTFYRLEFNTFQIAEFFAVILATVEIWGIPLAFLFHYFKSFSGASVCFLITNLSISCVWTGLQIYADYSKSGWFIIYFSYDSIPFFPTPALTYIIVFFIRRAVWKFNWNLKSEAQRNTYCVNNFNPCCKDENSSK